jgi:hypothetical protein
MGGMAQFQKIFRHSFIDRSSFWNEGYVIGMKGYHDFSGIFIQKVNPEFGK